jgi:hypothetical protein
MMTGYEQVRSVVAALAGDREAALATQLVLPETGVCDGAGVSDDSGCRLPADSAVASAGCCVPARARQADSSPRARTAADIAAAE